MSDDEIKASGGCRFELRGKTPVSCFSRYTHGTDDARQPVQSAGALIDKQVDFVVFGAIALMAHGLVRAAQDLDVFVRPEPKNIQRLRAALRQVYPDDAAIDEIRHEDLCGAYPAVRYNAPDGFSIDILERKDFAGVPVPVATPLVLYRMKRDTMRWKDKYDREALRERFDLKE